MVPTSFRRTVTKQNPAFFNYPKQKSVGKRNSKRNQNYWGLVQWISRLSAVSLLPGEVPQRQRAEEPCSWAPKPVNSSSSLSQPSVAFIFPKRCFKFLILVFGNTQGWANRNEENVSPALRLALSGRFYNQWGLGGWGNLSSCSCWGGTRTSQHCSTTLKDYSPFNETQGFWWTLKTLSTAQCKPWWNRRNTSLSPACTERGLHRLQGWVATIRAMFWKILSPSGTCALLHRNSMEK